MAACDWCNGGGRVVRLPGGKREHCPACHGTGQEPEGREAWRLRATADEAVRALWLAFRALSDADGLTDADATLWAATVKHPAIRDRVDAAMGEGRGR